MPSRRLTVALACVALGLAPGCGSDERTESAPDAPVPTVPQEKPSADTGSEPDTTTEPTAPEDPAPQADPDAAAPEPDPGGAVAPTEPETPADSPTNDTPPPPGSGAESFEKFCDSNPGACG